MPAATGFRLCMQLLLKPDRMLHANPIGSTSWRHSSVLQSLGWILLKSSGKPARRSRSCACRFCIKKKLE